jgi:hypothetical protein
VGTAALSSASPSARTPARAGCRRAQQRGQRLAGQHRHIAQGDNHVSGEIGKLVKSDLHCMAGPELFLLDRGLHMRSDLGKVRCHLIAKVPDHHDDVLGLQRRRGRHRITEHGMSGNLMQQLGTRRLHPLSLACCQDDDSSDRARSLVGVDRQQLAPY